MIFIALDWLFGKPSEMVWGTNDFYAQNRIYMMVRSIERERNRDK